MSAYKDAQAQNDITRNVKQYSDLDLFFTKRPVDKDVNTLTNAQAIKRAVRNLVLTNFYEKPFHPEIGSGVRELLFENASPLTSLAISQAITDVINNYEPRALLAGVEVIPRMDTNEYQVTVEFYINNAPTELIDLSFTLERIR